MSQSSEDVGKLIVRLVVSVLLLFHGYHYLYGMTNVDHRIVGMGLPAFIGDAGQWVGEVIAPILLILGVYSRIDAILIVIFMVVAILMAHTFPPNAHLLTLNDARAPDTIGDGYHLELQFLFMFGALSVFFFGGGKYGLNIGGKWN
jgi:putative oxidoreductase